MDDDDDDDDDDAYLVDDDDDGFFRHPEGGSRDRFEEVDEAALVNEQQNKAVLLKFFHWDTEKLYARFFDDRVRVCSEAGIDDSDVPFARLGMHPHDKRGRSLVSMESVPSGSFLALPVHLRGDAGVADIPEVIPDEISLTENIPENPASPIDEAIGLNHLTTCRNHQDDDPIIAFVAFKNGVGVAKNYGNLTLVLTRTHCFVCDCNYETDDNLEGFVKILKAYGNRNVFWQISHPHKDHWCYIRKLLTALGWEFENPPFYACEWKAEKLPAECDHPKPDFEEDEIQWGDRRCLIRKRICREGGIGYYENVIEGVDQENFRYSIYVPSQTKSDKNLRSLVQLFAARDGEGRWHGVVVKGDQRECIARKALPNLIAACGVEHVNVRISEIPHHGSPPNSTERRGKDYNSFSKALRPVLSSSYVCSGFTNPRVGAYEELGVQLRRGREECEIPSVAFTSACLAPGDLPEGMFVLDRDSVAWCHYVTQDGNLYRFQMKADPNGNLRQVPECFGKR